jgi:S1-C subfamily serine protease
VVAIGFPLAGLLGSDPSVTTGVISSLAGIKNDRRFIRITAPVQPGSSGGPLFGENGAVIGVVVGKLNAIAVAQTTGDIPQNVNFAVALGTLQSFLDANNVAYEVNEKHTAETPANIATHATSYTILLQCRR